MMQHQVVWLMCLFIPAAKALFPSSWSHRHAQVCRAVGIQPPVLVSITQLPVLLLTISSVGHNNNDNWKIMIMILCVQVLQDDNICMDWNNLECRHLTHSSIPILEPVGAITTHSPTWSEAWPPQVNVSPSYMITVSNKQNTLYEHRMVYDDNAVLLIQILS